MNISIEKSCHVVKHPVLQHKMTILRRKETRAWDFRKILTEISSYLAYAVTADIRVANQDIETPIEKSSEPHVAESLLVVSIQRAGSGMLEGFLQTLPFAKVGHIGIYRDKNIGSTVEYYFRIPNDSVGQKVILVDPMLATGDSAVAAINRLKDYDVGPIRLACIVAAPEGIQKVKEAHPDVEIYTTTVDRGLNAKGYIMPGLGDAGDRLFDTI